MKKEAKKRKKNQSDEIRSGLVDFKKGKIRPYPISFQFIKQKK